MTNSYLVWNKAVRSKWVPRSGEYVYFSPVIVWVFFEWLKIWKNNSFVYIYRIAVVEGKVQLLKLYIQMVMHESDSKYKFQMNDFYTNPSDLL